VSTRITFLEDKRRERRRDRHADRRVKRKPFAGVDGEGGDVDGQHEYLLLRAGDHVLETGEALGTVECLNFLTRLPNDVTYVSYFFDYDVTMMLRDIPPERLARLLDMDCRRIPGKPCSSFPLDWHGFQLDYLPRKEFRVRRRLRRNPDTGRVEWSPWIVINDCGSFYQSSFVRALEQWLHDASDDDGNMVPTAMGPVIARIAEGKEQRATFGAVTEDERQYNHLECILLARMMERFRDMCDRVNIRPAKWQGPGNLVSAVMKREGVPRNADIDLFDTMPDLIRMANDGYYGGRFEMSCYGDIPGPVYQYDINSAYANTYKDLPCLVHGKWEKTDTMPDAGIFVGEVHFKHRAGLNYCTLPVRSKKDGVLLFPREGNGTYWSPELQLAQKYAKVTWKTGYRYIKECDCSGFDWVYEIYAERKRMGSQGTGKVLKLVLASIYGKLAQSVGCAPYSNPIWASLIVSSVRATLADAALSVDGGRHVVMLATDGIFSTSQIDVPLGKGLGEWDLVVHESLFNVQSGIYFAGKKAPKTRGIPQSRVVAHQDDFRNAWERILSTGIVEKIRVGIRTFIGLRLALARNKPELAGTWIDHTKDVSFDWHSKRFRGRFKGRMLDTDPMPGGPNLTSSPYSRVIGGLRAAERLEFADQPEWAEQFL
jgi:hypothetical protein